MMGRRLEDDKEAINLHIKEFNAINVPFNRKNELPVWPFLYLNTTKTCGYDTVIFYFIDQINWKFCSYLLANHNVIHTYKKSMLNLIVTILSSHLNDNAKNINT